MIDHRTMQPHKGAFIVVEGGDGSGKGSLIEALSARLVNEGRDILVTREPGGTAEGLELRALLLSEKGKSWDEGAELLLMTAARIQHVKRVIQPALEAGRIVLCDRYVGSTLAYQGGGRGISETLIRGLHRDFVDDLWPDITLLLDVDATVGLERSLARLSAANVNEGRFEELARDFHERVRQNFLEQAAEKPEETIVIDAGMNIQQVHEKAISALVRWLSARGHR